MALRQTILDRAMTEPASTEVLPGVKVRKISLQTLSMLARIGSPLAQIDRLSSDDIRNLSVPDIAEFVFIHAAPPQAVRYCVYQDRSALAERADEFCAKFALSDFSKILTAITADAAAIQAAQVSVVPDSALAQSKNGQSPAA